MRKKLLGLFLSGLIVGCVSSTPRSPSAWDQLRSAVSRDDFQAAEYVIANTPNGPNHVNGLLYAIDLDNYKAVDYFLMKTSPNSYARETGMAALSLASARGNYKIAELLLSRGADVNGRDNKGLTALDHSRLNGHRPVAELLISYGGTGMSKLEIDVELSKTRAKAAKEQMDREEAAQAIRERNQRTDACQRACNESSKFCHSTCYNDSDCTQTCMTESFGCGIRCLTTE